MSVTESLHLNNSSDYTNLLFIDDTVEEYQLFADSANAYTFPIIYSSTSTKHELFSLLQTTFTNSIIDRIGVVFTSNNGTIKTFLDSKPFFTNDEPSVTPYSENVHFIISILKEFNVKNIDYLACDTLNYPIWENYYTLLTKETGVVVGASNDKTGNIKYGGDWIMESTSENIELVYFTRSIEYYSYLLDTQGRICIGFKADGTIWGTGLNSNGQLGDGTTTNRTTLTQMNTTGIGGRNPLYISCGDFFTLVLMTDGTIWGTGRNLEGELGDGTTTSRTTLTQMNTTVSVIGGRTLKYISGTEDNFYVLMTDGTIWGTGRNNNGQLGDGTTTDRTTLTQMTANNNNFTYIMGIFIEPVENIPIANICFPAGTPIQTDQGIIPIEQINPDIHTIWNKSIVDITKTITYDKFLVGFKKNALGFNYPTENTLMSQTHKVYYQGKMREAKTFLGKFEKVVKVKYTGEILYNVLMEDYSKIHVNKLICETLHPDNIIAKLYTRKSKYTADESDTIVVLLKECIKNKDYKTYNKILQQS